MFKGLFFFCDGPAVETLNITGKVDCLQFPGNKWVNQKYNFDNIFNALMALFVLSSKDGWVDIMYHGLDAVGLDKQVILKAVLRLKSLLSSTQSPYI